MGNTLVIPKLSILIPSIPSRIPMLTMLFDKLQSQVEDKPVEILSMLDNKRRSIGLKRDALVQSANGTYLTFVDDDDDISDDYVDSILNVVDENSDVIVFKQHAIINDAAPFIVTFGIEYENQEAFYIEEDGHKIWQDVVRKPFHSCVWKTVLAKAERFPDASYGEDWHWAKRILENVKTQTRIDKILHIYRYNDKITEALLDFPENVPIVPDELEVKTEIIPDEPIA